MKRSSFLAATVAISLGSFSVCRANMVANPGFEVNALTTAAATLGNYPGTQGIWGQEMSTIVGVDGGISPMAGSNQLKMDPSVGGVATQAFQPIDISAYAAAIDSNSAVMTASAYFNSQAPAAVAAVYVTYSPTSTYASNTGTDGNVITLDSNLGSWELNTMTKVIPAGTRWVLFQVAYNNASLPLVPGSTGTLEQSYGYVDNASLEIRGNAAPTPAAWGGGLALLAVGGAMHLRRGKVSAVR